MMFALPIATAVTSPDAFTVATAVFELLHTMTRPMRMAFDASRVVAVACVVAPVAMDDAANDTLTVATGAGVTTIDVDPLLPSLVATMLAVPTATPVTAPLLEFTVATAVFELVHTTARPANTAFDASRVTAVPCVPAPTTIDDAANDTLTVATGIAVTVTLA